MMMMSTTTPNPFSNPIANGLNTLGNFTYNLNERGKRRAVQLEQQAKALGPAAQVVASPFAQLLKVGTKTEFDHFSFTPELGGFTIPHLPLMATLIMFYGFMMPARIDSELKRSDKLTPQELQHEGVVNNGLRKILKLFYRDKKDKDGKKEDNKIDTVDMRAMRDVVIRDVLSISLFLFALEPAQQALRVKKQTDGGLFSFGKNHHQPVLAIMDRAWHPEGDMTAWSYEKTNRLYQLNSLTGMAHFANLFGANTYNRHNAEIFRIATSKVNLYAEDATFKTTADAVVGQLQKLGIAQNSLTNTWSQFYKEQNLKSTEKLGVDADLALSLLFEKLPTLIDVNQAERLKLDTLKAEVAQAKQAIEDRIEQSIKACGFNMTQLEALQSGTDKSLHHTVQPFAENFLKAFNDGDLTAYKKMMLLASNVGGFVDNVVNQQTDKTTCRFDRYGKVWNHLHGEAGLQDLLPQYHLLANTEKMLKEPKPAQSMVNGIQQLFGHSRKALAGITKLDGITQEARKAGTAVGVKNWLGKVADTFNVTDVFKEFARGMKAPVDWMTFVMVAGVIGFVPVWINQVYTDLEFKLNHANDKNPPKQEPLEIEDLDYLPLVEKTVTPPPNRFQTLVQKSS